MPRYVEIDDVEVSDYVTVWDCNCSEFGKQTVMAVDDLQYLPTADVVPKSEVERLEQLLDSNCEKCVCAARKMLNEETVREIEILRVRHLKRIAEAKAEVAREIFEEIERFLYLQFRFCKEELGNGDTKYMEGRLELNTQIQNFIAELKKKYI